jgi:integrase/recombinase XerD
MRYACKLRGLSYLQFSLPEIERPEKLPVVLSQQEMRLLLKSCALLKHSILLATIYGCGLRCAEVRQLAIADADLGRGMLHVRSGKGGKDRYVPLGDMLSRGIRKYLDAVHPVRWLFEGTNNAAFLSEKGYAVGSKPGR